MDNKDAIDRLPKWAQRELEKLRADVASLQTELAASLGEAETRVEVNPYSVAMGRSHRCFLGERETIRFNMGDSRFIDVRLTDDGVSVMGDNQLTVSPHASNVVYVNLANG